MAEKVHLKLTDFRQYPELPNKYKNAKTWLHILGVAFPAEWGAAAIVHVQDSKDRNVYRILLTRDVAEWMHQHDGLSIKIKYGECHKGLYQLEISAREIQKEESAAY
jgi:hypothetical protein